MKRLGSVSREGRWTNWKVRRVSRRDSVYLNRLPGSKNHCAARVNRRVHPFVQVNQVARVAKHAKKRIAQVTLDQFVHRPSLDTDPNRFIPFGHASKIGDSKLGQILGRGSRQLLSVRHKPTGPTGERSPEPESRREWVPMLDNL